MPEHHCHELYPPGYCSIILSLGMEALRKVLPYLRKYTASITLRLALLFAPTRTDWRSYVVSRMFEVERWFKRQSL